MKENTDLEKLKQEHVKLHILSGGKKENMFAPNVLQKIEHKDRRIFITVDSVHHVSRTEAKALLSKAANSDITITDGASGTVIISFPDTLERDQIKTLRECSNALYDGRSGYGNTQCLNFQYILQDQNLDYIKLHLHPTLSALQFSTYNVLEDKRADVIVRSPHPIEIDSGEPLQKESIFYSPALRTIEELDDRFKLTYPLPDSNTQTGKRVSLIKGVSLSDNGITFSRELDWDTNGRSIYQLIQKNTREAVNGANVFASLPEGVTENNIEKLKFSKDKTTKMMRVDFVLKDGGGTRTARYFTRKDIENSASDKEFSLEKASDISSKDMPQTVVFKKEICEVLKGLNQLSPKSWSSIKKEFKELLRGNASITTIVKLFGDIIKVLTYPDKQIVSEVKKDIVERYNFYNNSKANTLKSQEMTTIIEESISSYFTQDKEPKVAQKIKTEVVKEIQKNPPVGNPPKPSQTTRGTHV